MADRRYRLERRNHGKGHSYLIDGRKAVGVTTVLSALPKQLTDWAARAVAGMAIDQWAELAELRPSSRYEKLRGAPWADRDAAAVRGTKIHGLGEALAQGKSPDVPEELVGPVEAYARFMDAWDLHPVLTEVPSFHPQLGLAGTVDLWAHVGARGSELALIDLKSGKGVYESDALQVCAYAHLPIQLLDDQGTQQQAPQPEAIYVAHIHPDSVELLPISVTEDDWLQFRYLMQTYHWLQQQKDTPAVGAALQPPVRTS